MLTLTVSDGSSDVGVEVRRGANDVTADSFSNEIFEETFDLVDPEPRCWREVLARARL